MSVVTTDNGLAKLRDAEAEASKLHVGAKAIRDKYAADESVDLTVQDSPEFTEINDAFTAYGTAADEVEQLRDRIAELSGIDTALEGGPRPGLAGLLGDVSINHPEAKRADSVGRRFVASEAYAALEKAGVFETDQAFVSALGSGITPTEILTRDELEAALGMLRGEFGATTITGTSATSAGPFIQNDLVPGFFSYARKMPSLAQMVSNSPTDSDTVEYVVQGAPTTNAAETAEDSAGTEAVYPFATLTTGVKEIPAHVPVTNRAMQDHGQIRGIIENDLMTDVADRLDTQIAGGNGSGQNLTGIYNASGINTQARGGDDRPAAIQKAMTQIRVAAGVLAEPDFVGLHPADHETLMLEQDANGQYLFGGPAVSGPRTVWGTTIVTSTAFTSGTPLVGAYQRSSRLWTRAGVSVSSGLDGNDFTKRRITLLAVMRVAFAVIRVGGFTTVTGF